MSGNLGWSQTDQMELRSYVNEIGRGGGLFEGRERDERTYEVGNRGQGETIRRDRPCGTSRSWGKESRSLWSLSSAVGSVWEKLDVRFEVWETGVNPLVLP